LIPGVFLLRNIPQIAGLKMSELKPEQLQEFKVTFAHFDIDRDNKLSPHEFKAGCSGLGIDLKVFS
jgi:Ca2+-binding EF-hand superfamily protein